MFFKTALWGNHSQVQRAVLMGSLLASAVNLSYADQSQILDRVWLCGSS